MHIFTAGQIHEWDNYTILHEPISSIDLMERASTRCAEWIQSHFSDVTFKVFCGKGNNGGDGLAIARLLAAKNFVVEVYILEFGKPGTTDFQENLRRLHAVTTGIHFIQSEAFFPSIGKEDVVIDSVFGSGLNRPIESLAASLISHINSSTAKVISIDMPSGMFADRSSRGNIIINAKHTLTFQILKLCFLLPENEEYFGGVEVLDIGLHKDYKHGDHNPFHLTDAQFIHSIYRPRNKFSHKGTFGHALIIAGSKGKMGACLLASKACLRSGAGLLSAAVPEWGLAVIQSAFPEAMALPFQDTDVIDWDNYKSIGIGPGLGTEQQAKDLMKKTLSSFQRPMVIDADGLNILSKHSMWIEFISPGSILTPHPKEFERLFGPAANDFDKLQLALKNAAEFQIFIVLKGHYTFIACPDGQGYFNSTGNAGMATAGSGDVLTGMLTGLLCQGYEPKDAAILGVYLHGKAGDIAAAKNSQEALIASDIIENIGAPFREIAGGE
jgi:hydroxyethylthiazole kinase-like uncharacterized protein yjeF